MKKKKDMMYEQEHSLVHLTEVGYWPATSDKIRCLMSNISEEVNTIEVAWEAKQVKIITSDYAN